MGFDPFGLLFEPFMVLFLLLLLVDLVILSLLPLLVLVLESVIDFLSLLVGQLHLLLYHCFLLLALGVDHAFVDLASMRSDASLIPSAEDSIDAVVALEEVHLEPHWLRNLS